MPFASVPGLRADDARRCRAILRGGSRSFAAAARLLPRRERDAVAAVYAFCRAADDAIDRGGASRWTLFRLRRRLDGIYDGGQALEPADRALRAVVRHYSIPRSTFDALIEGFVWELEGRRYATIDDLHAYGVRVAATVGVAVACILGVRDEETLARACDLGVAMQLTNIARDVGEDARAGRLYLPTTWMTAAGLDPDAWLADPAFTPALGGVVRRLLAEADRLYRRSGPGIARLPRRSRWAIRAARLIYADIGRVIARHGLDSVSARAVTTASRKLWLAARAAVATRRTTHPAPSLPAARFLVGAAARPMALAFPPGPTSEPHRWYFEQETA